jgi:hypothetical protein
MRLITGTDNRHRLWASSQMLDLVQKSFGSEQVTPLEVFRVAATSMLFTASDDILRFLSQNNDAIVRVRRLVTPPSC